MIAPAVVMVKKEKENKDHKEGHDQELADPEPDHGDHQQDHRLRLSAWCMGNK